MTGRKSEVNVAAVSMDIGGDVAKYDAYVAMLPRLPKKDRRAMAAAGPQTKFVMEAVQQWYEFNYHAGSVAGLPKENVLHRAALLLPRAPLRAGLPIKDAPALVIAVNDALAELQDSRTRVLIACERFAQYGIERAARELGMTPASTKSYLKQARDSLAHVLRGMGWRVPKED